MSEHELSEDLKKENMEIDRLRAELKASAYDLFHVTAERDELRAEIERLQAQITAKCCAGNPV